MEGNNELMLVVAVIGGLIAGFLVGWLSRSSEGGKGEELERCREELERYRNEVGGHFAKTAELVGKMTAQYRAVYEHLAEGAHRLGGEQAKHLEAAIIQGESLLAGPADDEKTDAAESVEEAAGTMVTEGTETGKNDEQEPAVDSATASSQQATEVTTGTEPTQDTEGTTAASTDDREEGGDETAPVAGEGAGNTATTAKSA